MKPYARVGVVIGGYVAALLIAVGGVALSTVLTNDPIADPSSGMRALGDAILFLTIFGVLALVPTGAALFFLKPYARFWTVLSAIAVAMASTSVLAAIVFAAGRNGPPSPGGGWVDVAVLRMLAAPFLAMAFVACAYFSPERSTRRMFVAAIVAEAAVSVYGACVWVVPMVFQRS